MRNVTVEEVFTPGYPAELTYIERKKPEKQIKRALRNPGIQIIIYGHSGSGKTTVLRNILNEKAINHIKTRCTKGNKIEDILLDAFSQLGTFYSSSSVTKEQNEISSKIKFGLDFFGFGLSGKSKGSKEEKHERLVEIQKNPNLLAKLFGAVDSIWVIEDFHKLDVDPKRELSQIMKVFMDAAADYPNVKIVALGAVNSAREVVHYDSEMENRVSEVLVPLMNPDQLFNLISLGEECLNINFDQTVKEKIVAYSSGLASVTHQLCSLACEAKEIEERSSKRVEIKNDHLEYAINEYVNEKSDTLKAIYEQAIKSKSKRKHESPERLLEAILKTQKDSFTILDISGQLSKVTNNYKSNNLRRYIIELTQPPRGEILRYNVNADNFTFSTPFLRGYCHIHLIKYPQKDKMRIDKEYRNDELLRNYLNEEFQKFVNSIYSDSDEEFDLGFDNYRF